MTTQREQELAMILSGQRVVPYRLEYLRITGTMTGALLLAQIQFWQSCMGDGRWWYKSNAEWALELGMGADEFKAAKEAVRTTGVVEMEVKRPGGPTYFRLDYDALVVLLREQTPGGKSTSSRRKIHQPPVENPPTTIEEQRTPEKRSYGTQRASVEEVLEEFSGRKPTPANADCCFRKLWGHAGTGRPLVQASMKRLSMLGKVCSLLGDNWPEHLAATVVRWDDFCGQVAADKGVKRSPAIPTVEYMLAHVDVMAAMSRKITQPKQAAVIKGPKHRSHEQQL